MQQWRQQRNWPIFKTLDGLGFQGDLVEFGHSYGKPHSTTQIDLNPLKITYSSNILSRTDYVPLCMWLQSCLTLCNAMDCRPPGSSIRGIFQARVLEWVAMPSSRRSFQPRDWTLVSCVLYWQVGSLPLVAPGKPMKCLLCTKISKYSRHCAKYFIYSL